MPNFLDYLIPQTMGHVRNVENMELRRTLEREALEKQRALETLAAFQKQPDMFSGVSGQNVPSPEVLAAYTKGTGLQWPTEPVEQTGAPPPGVAAPVQGLSSNMPQETLAVMRSPLSQATNEVSQKTVAEAMAKLKAREATLPGESALREQEFQAKAQQIPGQISTLGQVLKPYGYDDADVAAQVTGKYPGAREAQLKRESHYPPRETIPRLYATAEGMLPYDQAIGKPKALSGAQANALPPHVKLAQQVVSRLTPVVTGQMTTTQALIMGLIPEAQQSPMMRQALEQGKLPPELKAIYDAAIQTINAYMSVPTGAAAAPEQATTSNDPLGIR